MVWLESNILGLLNLEFLYEGGTAPVESTKSTAISSASHSLYICLLEHSPRQREES